jgi:hypothetical protein
MKMQKKYTLEEVLKKPIRLPKNSFVEGFKRFMKYELIDFGVILSTTTALGYAIDHQLLGPLSKTTQDILLTGVGPVLGKIAFIGADTKDRMAHARSMTHKDKKPFFTDLKESMKSAGIDLLENVSVQDTTYMAAMAAFLGGGSKETPFMLSLLSYGISMGAVSIADLGLNDLRFKNYCRKLRKAGFIRDDYHEATFCIKKDMNQEKLLEQIANEFKLSDTKHERYHDKYLPTHLLAYNGKKPKLRFREIIKPDGTEVKMVQITYAKVKELLKKSQDQFRYFAQKKTKLAYRFEQEMPWEADAITNEAVRGIVRKANHGADRWEMKFKRNFAFNDDMLCSYDEVFQAQERPFYVIELKSRSNIHLLEEGMRFVMGNFPVIETTYEKLDLAGATDYCR